MKLMLAGVQTAIVRAVFVLFVEAHNTAVFRSKRGHHWIQKGRIRVERSFFCFDFTYFAGSDVEPAGEDNRSPSSGADSGEDRQRACVAFLRDSIGSLIQPGPTVLTLR